LSQACKEYGLKFGVYISPWDRNHPKYGTAEYNDVFVNMMKEIFTNYGPIWELWWDGANGEGPNGKKQVYDWDRFKKTVRTLSPNTVIFSDVGPDIRWCGNENGIAGKTNWNLLDTVGFTPGAGAPAVDILNRGNENGKNWIPAECDVSIRPGWFYHKEEDDKIKSPEELFQLYLKSVGRGANLLLNVPPDRAGMINEKDSIALVGFKKLRDESFKNNLANSAKHSVSAGDSVKEIWQIHFSKPVKINCVVLKEEIKNGQAIEKFSLELQNDAGVIAYLGATVGRKRVMTFPVVETNSIFLKSKGKIKTIEVYLIPENLIEK